MNFGSLTVFTGFGALWRVFSVQGWVLIENWVCDLCKVSFLLMDFCRGLRMLGLYDSVGWLTLNLLCFTCKFWCFHDRVYVEELWWKKIECWEWILRTKLLLDWSFCFDSDMWCFAYAYIHMKTECLTWSWCLEQWVPKEASVLYCAEGRSGLEHGMTVFRLVNGNLISYVFVDLVYSTGFRIRFVKGKYHAHWFVFSFWFIYGKEGTFSMFCLIMLPTILPMVFTDPYLNTFSLLETGELGHFIAVWGSSWKICRLSTSLFINLWSDTRRRDIGASHYHTVCA